MNLIFHWTQILKVIATITKISINNLMDVSYSKVNNSLFNNLNIIQLTISLHNKLIELN